MELTDKELETIKKTVRDVEYGSVTINISATSDNFDLNVNKRIKIKRETLADKKTLDTNR